MKFTPRIDEAVRLASRLHREQTRRDRERSPYISHLVSVAMMISEHTDDEEIIISGLMHDSLEDVPEYNYERLVEDCGARVADIVSHVTEPLDADKDKSDQMPWLERKQEYLKKLAEGGIESSIVSACDKIHNTRTFILDMKIEKEEFLKRFGSSHRNKIWFNEEVIKILKDKLGESHQLVSNLTKCTKELDTLISEYEAK